ncbi:transglycosylase domain-containing protein [Microbacterium sp. P06]|uniref:transglycosylase domain-containing protein n=1 Tax=Microbacterium sp. P06 TaxID=3366949 RepID=UPI0037458018
MPDKKRTPTGALGGLLGLVGLSAVAGVLITATVTPAIAVSGAAASSAIKIFDNMPSILEIGELMQPTTLIYTRPDTKEEVEFTSFFDQDRSPVTFDQVAPVVYDAILSSEDPRYYQHGGVDLIGTTRALLSNAQGGATQGGSSISQQYVKNVLIQQCERNAEAVTETADDGTVTTLQTRDEVLQSCWMEATNATGADGYERKLQEMRYAIQLEKEYSKDEILLGYLNIANFGGTTYGIDAAAKYYFNTPASALSLGQAATLAGIVQNPNTYRIDKVDGSTFDAAGNPINSAADGYSVAKTRQLYVLDRMLVDGKITQEQHDAAAAEPITPTITPAQTGCASTGKLAYFCAYVVSTIQNDPAFGETAEDRTRALRQDGLRIYTTLDPRLQVTAENSMVEYAPSSVPGMDFGSTAVSVEAGTGRVLALAQNTQYTPGGNGGDNNLSSIVFAGNLEFGASKGFNAGSTFKLFTLIDWLEQGKSLREVVNGRDRPVPNMTNSCTGNWVNQNRTQIFNFNRQAGFNGTPLQFTASSLNTGYLGMAAELDLCDIANVATKMGVSLGSGEPITMPVANTVIGSDEVSPLAMAGAYATVANGGQYCQTKVIDRVTDSKGNDRPELVPDRSCNQVLTTEVASTAAFALQGVMARGGTGNQGNPNDGTPLIGKTGTHQELQSWMIESSSNVTTAVWAGNWNGSGDISRNYANGRRLMDIRYPMASEIQREADNLYGGNEFPQPDGNLTRQVLRNVPNVVGQSIEQARSTLTAAGFEVTVGDPVDSDQSTDVVAAQNPAGQAGAGANITINPSNGQAARVPTVAGSTLSAAVAALQGAGFTNLTGSCSVDPGASSEGRVGGTNPNADSFAKPSAPIAVSYVKPSCP